MLFQSTHPSWGATLINTPRWTARTISIHAPIVGCDVIDLTENNSTKISIHAPIVGCDTLSTLDIYRQSNFNPRTHRGVRRNIGITFIIGIAYFNPRTHRGVRLCCSIKLIALMKFQSTHPSWGATNSVSTQASISLISIHAPIVGCDQRAQVCSYLYEDFNPRTHRGVRRFLVSCSVLSLIFQSTHPSWGATYKALYATVSENISIHAPIVGCDEYSIVFDKHIADFNPRTHRGVRHYWNVIVYAYDKISIHAPIVGCDSTTLFNNKSLYYFNPRTHRGVRL